MKNEQAIRAPWPIKGRRHGDQVSWGKHLPTPIKERGSWEEFPPESLALRPQDRRKKRSRGGRERAGASRSCRCIRIANGLQRGPRALPRAKTGYHQDTRTAETKLVAPVHPVKKKPLVPAKDELRVHLKRDRERARPPNIPWRQRESSRKGARDSRRLNLTSTAHRLLT